MAHRIIGWLVDAEDRAALLVRIPPRFARIVAHHVTLASRPPAGTPLPAPARAVVIGEIDDGAGVQALVVAIDGHSDRPGGGTFHITWSLGEGRHARESNDVIAARGWRPIAPTAAVRLHPAELGA